MLSEQEKSDIARAYKDAADKAASLPARLKDEAQQAEAENREPYPVQPLTGVAANLVVKAIEEIKGDVSADLSEIIGVQRRSCGKLGKVKVYLLSEQLKDILDAAGFGPAPTPPPPIPKPPPPSPVEV